MDTTARQLLRLIPAAPAADGAGVKLWRSLGQSSQYRHDPFLMLDEFVSDNPDDYIAGFPAHPHRGFETVTYMLHGHMLHEDHLGNRGNLREGGVQWMTAGRGIVHSEMPQQREGLMQGFQLWINLPAAEKMRSARYRDAAATDIPESQPAPGVVLRHIAGSCRILPRGETRTGLFNGLDGQPLSSDPLFVDIQLQAGAELQLGYPANYASFCYVYQGQPLIAGSAVPPQTAALLTGGDTLTVRAEQASRLLLLAGRPFGEPIVQYGPFVMNTEAQIEQALQDYHDGVLVTP